ncbi:unnamed protein product [Periconia digitata]|uniref:Uncharacterized protein n=1 Tax=Periconia digitata TaxID=1303443 RepID=A0A9W4U282_9PLEO|nr:unnamed protein product [Periconia digitata]
MRSEDIQLIHQLPLRIRQEYKKRENRSNIAATNQPYRVKESVLDVLAHALPTSAVAAAISNQPAFISEIASAVSAGQTPSWYGALPTDVKVILAELYPVATAAPSSSSAAVSSSSSSASSTPAPSVSVTSSASFVASTGATISSGSNSTSVTSINSPTLSAPSSPPASSNTAPPANQNGAAAGFSTHVLGSSIAGALGVVAMLLL